MTFILLLAFGALVWFVITYNRLRAGSEIVKGAKSNIMAATRKRVDLAKRISDVAGAYATHEKLTQLSVSDSMSNISESLSAEKKVNQVMGQVSALAVAYPELKANSTYEKLMNQWENLENDIHDSRENYNSSVTDYNAYQGALPQVIYAKAVGFGPAPYYQTELDDNDGLAEFVTGDGEMLKETMGRLKDKSKVAAQKAKVRLDEAKKNLEAQKENLPKK